MTRNSENKQINFRVASDVARIAEVWATHQGFRSIPEYMAQLLISDLNAHQSEIQTAYDERAARAQQELSDVDQTFAYMQREIDANPEI